MHKSALKYKQPFHELSKRDTHVWVMMRDASVANEGLKTSTSREIKSFFRTIHVLIKRNLAHTNNFSDLVKVIASYGTKDIRNHLVSATAECVEKHINKYSYLKISLLQSLRNSHFTCSYRAQISHLSSNLLYVPHSNIISSYETFYWHYSVKQKLLVPRFQHQTFLNPIEILSKRQCSF